METKRGGKKKKKQIKHYTVLQFPLSHLNGTRSKAREREREEEEWWINECIERPIKFLMAFRALYYTAQ